MSAKKKRKLEQTLNEPPQNEKDNHTTTPTPSPVLTVVIQAYNNPKRVLEIWNMLHTHAKESSCSKIHMVVLEKGTTTNYLIPDDTNVSYHQLSNNGREYGSYLWYCSHYYDALIDDGMYVFTSANLNKHNRRKRLKQALILSTTTKNNPTKDLFKDRRSRRKRKGNRGVDYSFTQEEWLGDIQTPAEVRPFGKWFEQCVCPASFQHILTQNDSKKSSSSSSKSSSSSSSAKEEEEEEEEESGITPFHDCWIGQKDEYSNGLVVANGYQMKRRLTKEHWTSLWEQTERGGNAGEVGHYLEKASYYIWAPYETSK